MDNEARRLVQNIVARAHDCAFSALGPELETANPLQRRAVLSTIDQFHAYVEQGPAQGPWLEELPGHLRTLIGAQDDLVTIKLLIQYSEFLNYFLVYASKRLHQGDSGQDN
jgi:hypothetical protein